MITKFKIFENLSIKPEVGNWVIIDDEVFKYGAKIFYNYIKDKIFQIEWIYTLHGGTDKRYQLKIENFPEELKGIIKDFRVTDFKYWTNNKDELEELLTAKKYNL